MGGYVLGGITPESLLEFAKEEYDYIKWDTDSLQQDDDYLALWGWDEDGTYIVVLATYYERTDKEIAERIEMQRKFSEVTEEDIEMIRRGWFLKFMNEVEGPVIQPTPAFLKRRPPLTLEAKRGLKAAEERHEFVEMLQEVHSDPHNKGTIRSAKSCDNGQVFIWTSQGNYYIPKSAYNSDLAMLGVLTVEFLRENNVPMIPTLEEHPYS